MESILSELYDHFVSGGLLFVALDGLLQSLGLVLVLRNFIIIKFLLRGEGVQIRAQQALQVNDSLLPLF